MSGLPSRRAEARSRVRGQDRGRGASHDEPQEKQWPVRTHRRPAPCELAQVLDGVPPRLASRIKER